MYDHRSLPKEIWLEIFEWATYNSSFPQDHHAPFRDVPHHGDDSDLPVRASLSGIRPGAHALKRALEVRQPSGRSYGESVQRVVLPYQSTVPTCFPLSLEILGLCSYLHTLIRPQRSVFDGLNFDNEVMGVSLPSLQHLEWWHSNEAERSGGINSLGAVLRGAPNIHYLFIGGVVGTTTTLQERQNIILPHLRILRLYIRSGLFLRQIITRWSLPSLTHLVLDSPPVKDGLQEVWEVLGDRLETVEFGKHVRFWMNDCLTPCLKGCPNLKELNYYLFFTAPPESTYVHSNLTTIGLHPHVNALLDDGNSIWTLIDQHFEILCGVSLPGLQRVVLHGDWGILRHPRFAAIQENLRNSGRELQLSEQTQMRLI
ncbi:hypothetical protein JR316_0000441 [Psilocybe cubensis]|uniref:Uncharacterized protein n=1 Tax=Psilocybe cubensis TaxID=181762 RepID=A0ACB8HF86_PSICU|nr:hypothetical protein JR316_0000441 [Psilocybe cubensis]KAH9486377.1 hypothetical protein JR316_0000441 [Psilocybe cubensis]